MHEELTTLPRPPILDLKGPLRRIEGPGREGRGGIKGVKGGREGIIPLPCHFVELKCL